MRYLLILLLGMPPFFPKAFGQTELANASPGYIYVKKPAKAPSLPSPAPRGNLYQHTLLYRLDLAHRINLPLMQAPLPPEWNTPHQGLVMLLVEGLRQQRFTGFHPDRPSPYTYEDLILDLMELEDIPVNQFNEEAIFEVVESSMQHLVELVVKEGFSTLNSRRFFRIQFFRLMWHNPRQSAHPHALALIPFHTVGNLMDEIRVKPHPEYHDAIIRMADFLKHQRFRGVVLEIDDQPLAAPYDYHRHLVEEAELLWAR